MRSRRPALAATSAVLGFAFAAAPLAAQDPHGHALRQDGPVYVPHRVYDAGAERFIDFEVLAAELAGADVVLFGERHGDPGTHRLQRALLEGLLRRRREAGVVVSLEMFERDVQPLLDAYLAGEIPEDEFLAGARPWRGYPTDHRPLVEIARAHGWPVVAANLPRRIAADIGQHGLEALDALPPEERDWVADRWRCPADDYYRRFVERMAEHPAPATDEAAPDEPEPLPPEVIDRFYLAQCLKDETMAESIAQDFTEGGPGTLVVHFNGAFHTDYGHGTAQRTARRLPAAAIRIVSALPVPDLDEIDLDPHSDRADFLLFTLAPAH